MTDSYMAGTTIRHVDELVPLTTEQYMGMVRQPTVRRHVYEAKNGNHATTKLNVNRLTATLFSNFGAR